MWTEASVKAAFGADAADKEVGTILDSLAPTLVRLLNREVTGKEASEELKGALALGKSIAGRPRVEQKGSALDLRKANLQNLDVGDVAGGDLTKLTSIVVNIGGTIFEISERTPYHDIEQRIVALIKNMDAVALGNAVTLLGADDVAKTIGPLWAVARGLVRTDFPTLREVVKAVATAACDEVALVIDTASPFCWVPADAAAAIVDVLAKPPTERGVALNSKDPRTGMDYVNRAPGPRVNRWVSPVNGGWGEDIVGHIRTEVEEFLRMKRICSPGDNCIDLVIGAGATIFVVLPPPAPGPKLLDELRAAMPGFVFVLLAGDAPDARPRFEELKLSHVDFLTPELAAGVETDARLQAKLALTVANLACN